MNTNRIKHKHAQCLSRTSLLHNGSELKPYKHKNDKHKEGGKTYIIIDIKNKRLVYAGISKNPEMRIQRHLRQMTTDTSNKTRIRASTNHLIAYLEYFKVKWSHDIKMIVLKRYKTRKAAALTERELINLIQMNFQMSKGNGNTMGEGN